MSFQVEDKGVMLPQARLKSLYRNAIRALMGGLVTEQSTLFTDYNAGLCSTQ